MKKLIIGGAAIAILGYLGVVGYLHQFDKENATQLLMENRYTGEQEKVAKALFDNSCQYCHSPNTLFHFIQNSRLWVMKCNRIFKVGFVLSA